MLCSVDFFSKKKMLIKLFFHRYSWKHVLKQFSSDYHVVAVDTRGYGDSDKPDGKQPLKTSNSFQNNDVGLK